MGGGTGGTGLQHFHFGKRNLPIKLFMQMKQAEIKHFLGRLYPCHSQD